MTRKFIVVSLICASLSPVTQNSAASILNVSGVIQSQVGNFGAPDVVGEAFALELIFDETTMASQVDLDRAFGIYERAITSYSFSILGATYTSTDTENGVGNIIANPVRYGFHPELRFELDVTNNPTSFLQFSYLWQCGFIFSHLCALDTPLDALPSEITGHLFVAYYLARGTYTATIRPDFEPPGPIPVPAAIWLFGSALVGLIGLGKFRKAD